MNSEENIANFFNAIRLEKVKKVVELVQSKNVDVNYRFSDHGFETATHIAASKSNLKLLKALVEDLHSDLNVVDKYNQVPIECAAAHHNYGAIKYLLIRVPAHASKVKDHINTAEVDKFFDAIVANDLSKVRRMLKDNIVDVNIPNKTDHHNTALHIACDKGNMDMVKLLVDKFNADVNAVSSREELPIHLSHEDEVTAFLVSRGSEVVDQLD